MIKKVLLLGCCFVFSIFMPTKAFGGYELPTATMSSVSGLGARTDAWRAKHGGVDSYYSSSAAYENNNAYAGAYNGAAYSGPDQYGSLAHAEQLAMTADQYALKENLGLVDKLMFGIVPIDPPTGVDEEECPIGDGILLLLIGCIGYALYRRRQRQIN